MWSTRQVILIMRGLANLYTLYVNCPRRLNLIMSLLRRIGNWILNKAFWTEDEDLWTMHVLDN